VAPQAAEGVALYDSTQLAEGMQVLPNIPGAIAEKYSGGGYGGYALYLFDDPALRDRAIASTSGLRSVEPFCKN
jgi:hypothetical protein